jgi:hypothetical protein
VIAGHRSQTVRGDVDDEAVELREQVARGGLGGHFHFAGFQPDTVPYIQAMDIIAMCSISEGISLAMLEFMAMGKPIVATCEPSFQETIVHDHSDVLVALQDSIELAAGSFICCATRRWPIGSARGRWSGSTPSLGLRPRAGPGSAEPIANLDARLGRRRGALLSNRPNALSRPYDRLPRQDLPVAVEADRALLPDAQFYTDDECLKRRYDLVLASGSFHYSQNWSRTLAGLAGATGSFLFVTQLPLVRGAASLVVVQRPYGHGYDTEYVGWCLNRHEFLQTARDQRLRLVREFINGFQPSIHRAPAPAEYRGYLFEPAA